MTISDITAALESFAPLHLQESYDNAGLHTGSPSWECTGVLCTLDATEEVVDEAVARRCNCIVAHHPPIFRPLRTLSSDDSVTRTLLSAIRANVAIYAAHTNVDNVPNGVNGRIADQLGLTDRTILQPRTADTGAGLLGTLAEPIAVPAFLGLLADRFHSAAIRHTDWNGGHIRRVAVCGGSGSFLIGSALDAGADAYVTADLKYHEFFTADHRLLLCDIGHYESEQFTIDLFADILLRKFPTFAVLKSRTVTNPVRYFTGN